MLVCMFITASSTTAFDTLKKKQVYSRITAFNNRFGVSVDSIKAKLSPHNG